MILRAPHNMLGQAKNKRAASFPAHHFSPIQAPNGSTVMRTDLVRPVQQLAALK
jgi:hypothetical protein